MGCARSQVSAQLKSDVVPKLLTAAQAAETEEAKAAAKMASQFTSAATAAVEAAVAASQALAELVAWVVIQGTTFALSAGTAAVDALVAAEKAGNGPAVAQLAAVRRARQSDCRLVPVCASGAAPCLLPPAVGRGCGCVPVVPFVADAVCAAPAAAACLRQVSVLVGWVLSNTDDRGRYDARYERGEAGGFYDDGFYDGDALRDEYADRMELELQREALAGMLSDEQRLVRPRRPDSPRDRWR